MFLTIPFHYEREKYICYVQDAPAFQVNINGHDIIIYNEKIEEF